ncbi:serine hydrolase domain-containing protein [Halanaerobium kushneri]|jgi:D-alanyl-D-alanine carboxypeptidase|nr:serine hydrolase domain-containing protein [Halanaerobium kushneri]
MKKEKLNEIENTFRKRVKKDSKVKNAYLLLHSDKLNFHLNIAEGKTADLDADPQQPNYMASVGKLFTSTIISILYERGKLDFNDKISSYLDDDLLSGLHIYKGKDYTDSITIKHLLKQRSGLYDDFWPLLDKIIEDSNFNMSPRKAVIWAKNNLKSYSPPGRKTKYTDTNYHILGLIIENITKKPFHEVLKDEIFLPLAMKKSSMLHYSEPLKAYSFPTARFSINGKVLNDSKAFAGLDFSGGGVVATTEDLLKFMQALNAGELIKKETLKQMISDSNKLFFGVDYGYGIWKFKTIPILMPEKYYCWGCVGATGAFMFYHPQLDTYLIGNFNDVSYQRKGLKFMINVIKKLLKAA